MFLILLDHLLLLFLQYFANVHVTRSFQFLLMSTYFGNYETNREGFSKLYKKLSDEMWHKAIDIIKYITKRGGKADLKYKKEAPVNIAIDTFEMHEIGSLAKAIDMMKAIAEEAHHIHGEIARRRDAFHDPEIASFIENEFVHKHSEKIRELAGHANDLKKILSSNDANLGLFLFDSYLKKIVS